MPKTPVLTPAMIEELKRTHNPETGKYYTQRDIANRYGVTASYVSWVKKNKSTQYAETPREKIMKHYPWTPGERFHAASPNKRLRDHAEFVATGGKGMDQEKLQRLLWFYRMLDDENLVIEFDPDIPPSEGIGTGGFAYRTRTGSDGDLMIRVNEHATLTDTGRMIWRLPPRSEWPTIR